MNLTTQWAATRSAWIGIVALTATVTLFMLARAYPTFPGDERALLNFQALQSDRLDSLATSVSNLGVAWVFVPLILGLTAGLIVLNRRVDALIVVLSLLPIIAGNALKLVVERPRPDYLLV